MVHKRVYSRYNWLTFPVIRDRMKNDDGKESRKTAWMTVALLK